MWPQPSRTLRRLTISCALLAASSATLVACEASEPSVTIDDDAAAAEQARLEGTWSPVDDDRFDVDTMIVFTLDTVTVAMPGEDNAAVPYTIIQQDGDAVMLRVAHEEGAQFHWLLWQSDDEFQIGWFTDVSFERAEDLAGAQR